MVWAAYFQAKTRLELGVKQGCEREAVPPRLPSGWAAGLDLDRLRGVFREPDGTTARGWKDAEVSWSCFCRTPVPRRRKVFCQPVVAGHQPTFHRFLESLFHNFASPPQKEGKKWIGDMKFSLILLIVNNRNRAFIKGAHFCHLLKHSSNLVSLRDII